MREPARKTGGISFMWFKKKIKNIEIEKTELEKLIISYGKDQEDLLQFARTVGKPRIEECTLEDIKGYYTAIVEPMNALSRRMWTMKAVRKFFRANRGENVLKARLISDYPLNVVVRNDILPEMTEKIKRPKGHPKNREGMKKVMVLREEGKLSFREIARALNKDSRQVYLWYKYSIEERKQAKRGKLSTV